MKQFPFLFFVLFSTLASAQIPPTPLIISISPTVDQTSTENKSILTVVEVFLQTKNHSETENEFWLTSDFDKYIYPYHDIHKIEIGSQSVYQPTIMEIIPIDDLQKLVKIGFLGINSQTEQSLIRCIYNVIATKTDGKWKLKRSLEYETRTWHIRTEKSITYYIAPGKTLNKEEIQRQSEDINKICDFFETNPQNITYYSCINPKQTFEIKGFDYLPNMYFSKTGGMADFANTVYSGNNSEYYTHEIVHIYALKLFPKIPSLLNEGIATYIGGSGLNGYGWHREKLAHHMRLGNENLANYMTTYAPHYITDETSIPYMVGALICERTHRVYGKQKLLKLLGSKTELWESLNDVGLTKSNLTQELQKELKLPVLEYFDK